MENEKQESTVQSEACHLVESKYRREDDFGPSVMYVYDLCIRWMIKKTKEFQPSAFPQSLGKLRKMRGSNQKWRISDCDETFWHCRQ